MIQLPVDVGGSSHGAAGLDAETVCGAKDAFCRRVEVAIWDTCRLPNSVSYPDSPTCTLTEVAAELSDGVLPSKWQILERDGCPRTGRHDRRHWFVGIRGAGLQLCEVTAHRPAQAQVVQGLHGERSFRHSCQNEALAPVGVRRGTFSPTGG